MLLRRRGIEVSKYLEKVSGHGTGERFYIVMACEDLGEAAQVSRQLSQVNNGALITYRRAEDVMLNCPSGRVALIILANSDDPETMGKILSWMRHRWPRCPAVVIGETGAGDMEIAARKGGASYLTRPVSPQQWDGLVQHVLSTGISAVTAK